jgi:hypothetical protein
MTGFSFLMRKRRCSASIRRDGRACWWHGSYTSIPDILLPRDHELDEALIEEERAPYTLKQEFGSKRRVR